MEFNIAFNTVFYISIFIIPGILLRRFYYQGEFTKEFSQGNLLERLMWTIFSSILSLLTSAFFFISIRSLFGRKLLPQISYATIKDVFDLLATNLLPEGAKFKAIYSDFFILIAGIYLLAILMGFLAHKIVISVGTNTSFSIIKFKNYWYYFFRGRVKNISIDKSQKYWYTEADIVIEQDGKSKMYSGKISDYYIDGSTNTLESIFLEDIKKYKFKEGEPKYELIEIPGNIFCVPYSRVLNMNLTYVLKEKGVSLMRKIIWWIVQAGYSLGSLSLFIIFWIDDIPFIEFDGIWYKGAFLLNTWIIFSLVRSMIKKYIVTWQNQNNSDSFLVHIISILFFISQYLWIQLDRTFWSVFIITTIFSLALLGVLEEKTLDSEEEVKVKEDEEPSKK